MLIELVIDEDGWVKGVLQIPSSNHDERPDGMPLSLIVIHSISLPPEVFAGPSVTSLFTNALDPERNDYYRGICGLRVSAHFFIRRDGVLVQYVPCHLRAWHAGVSSWQGRERCNDFSVGVELEGSDSTPFADQQYDTLRSLVSTLKGRYQISHVAGHCDIAPGRKTDPGPFFDWLQLA